MEQCKSMLIDMAEMKMWIDLISKLERCKVTPIFVREFVVVVSAPILLIDCPFGESLKV